LHVAAVQVVKWSRRQAVVSWASRIGCLSPGLLDGSGQQVGFALAVAAVQAEIAPRRRRHCLGRRFYHGHRRGVLDDGG
jgi:hypothetical protein